MVYSRQQINKPTDANEALNFKKEICSGIGMISDKITEPPIDG